jgi:cholesterol transport system auxiliary component
MRNANLLGLVCLTAALASLAGCAGKIRYPSYYVLNLPAPAPQATKPKLLLGSVAVREFRAPAFLRAGPIVYHQSADQLDFYDYHRWAVDPRSAITSAVVQDMQTGGVFQSVHLFDGRGTSDYLVTGTLDHLEEVDHGRDVFVEVRVSAQLMDLKTGDVLWRDASSETTKLENRDFPGIVAGMSQAADRAVEHLVSSMQTRVVSISASLGRTEAGQ